MKTNFGVFALGIGFVSLVFCLGCQEDQAKANGPLFVDGTTSIVVAPAEADAKPSAPPATRPAEATVPVVKNEAPPPPPAPAAPAAGAVPPGSIIITKDSAANPAPATNVAVAPPAGPPALSPALAEVVRLLEANVSQDVVMTYITNSTQPFNIGASEIVYLHDLGVPPVLITTLINIDSSPEMVARKQAATAVKPLPPGVALNEPATNLFIPRGGMAAVANPPEPVPVYPPTEASVAYTPAPTEEVPYDVAPPPVEVNYSYFYGSLAPYGAWCDVPGYGYCWRPTCATWNASWRPYGDCGRWLWSNSGWYWYSDYSWGWAPFHYGRWCRPAGYGWCWVPDTCWGPSWVSWRYSPSYCGWAPLPPSACYTTGFGFTYNSGAVGIGFEFGLGAADYCYIPTAHFCDRRPYDYYVPYNQNHAVHKTTTVVNNYVVGNNNTIINNGVGFDRIAKVTRGDIRQVSLRDTTSVRSLGTRHDRLESDGKTLTVYRPPAATLAHKSVVSAPRNPSPQPVRTASYVKPSSVSYAGKNSLTEPDAARSPAAQAPRPNIYIGNNGGSSRTVPTPVTVYTKPLDSTRQPVIVTGGPPLPAPHTQAATPTVVDTETPAIESQRGSKPAAPGLAGKSGGPNYATHQDAAAGSKESQQPSLGYNKPAPGNASPSRVAPTGKSPAYGSAPGVGPAPKNGQMRDEPNGAYQKPFAPTAPATPAAPVARSGGPGVSAPPPSAPPANYSRPAPSYNAPADNAPGRVEAHQSHVAGPSSAPSSAPSSSPRASAPSGGPSGGYSGGSAGSSAGKSSGSAPAPTPSSPSSSGQGKAGR